MAIEIVDFTINSMVIFHCYVSLSDLGILQTYFYVVQNHEILPWQAQLTPDNAPLRTFLEQYSASGWKTWTWKELCVFFLVSRP